MTDGLSSGVPGAGIVAPWPPRPLHGLDAAAAAVRLRAEAERLVLGAPLDTSEAAAVVAPFVDATEAAIADLNDEFRQLTAHVLRMARYRLGLC